MRFGVSRLWFNLITRLVWRLDKNFAAKENFSTGLKLRSTNLCSELRRGFYYAYSYINIKKKKFNFVFIFNIRNL